MNTQEKKHEETNKELIEFRDITKRLPQDKLNMVLSYAKGLEDGNLITASPPN